MYSQLCTLITHCVVVLLVLSDYIFIGHGVTVIVVLVVYTYSNKYTVPNSHYVVLQCNCTCLLQFQVCTPCTVSAPCIHIHCTRVVYLMFRKAQFAKYKLYCILITMYVV